MNDLTKEELLDSFVMKMKFPKKYLYPADKMSDPDKPFSFTELTDPLVKAVNFAYKLERQNREHDIPWEGPEIGKPERACCLLAAEGLSSQNLCYSEDEQGREALEEILGLAVRLGIEQGRRIEFHSLGAELTRMKDRFLDE